MSVSHFEVFVEEYSMEQVIRSLLATHLTGATFEVYPFQDKQDLLSELPARLRAYSRFLPADWRIIVLVDRDTDDCHHLKATLESAAMKAGLRTRTAAPARYQVVNRIVIEELEAWYFGDWSAVAKAYSRVPANIIRKAAFRDSDAIKGGTWEALERVLQKAGYFRTGLRKIELARAIVPHLDPSRNTSNSFQCFWNAIREMVTHP